MIIVDAQVFWASLQIDKKNRKLAIGFLNIISMILSKSKTGIN
jgi:hypothetical protein